MHNAMYVFLGHVAMRDEVLVATFMVIVISFVVGSAITI
jgi:hypothetical protein